MPKIPKTNSIHLFLSYAHADENSVYGRIIRPIKGKYNLWYDIAIPPTTNFWDEIDEHIRTCRVFLFALSPQSIQSDACKHELKLAYECGIVILPLLIEPIDQKMLPPELEKIQWLDLTGVMTDEKTHLLSNSIKQAIGKKRPWRTYFGIMLVFVLGIFLGAIAAWLIIEPPSPTPPSEQTLRTLIEQEAEAVLNQDEQAIRAIYIDDAIIEDADPHGRIWVDPLAYYAEKRVKEAHCRVEHLDLTIEVLASNYARATTSSQGEFGLRAENNGCPYSYNNPPGADIWEFVRDESGEWQIVRFTYNAHAKK